MSVVRITGCLNSASYGKEVLAWVHRMISSSSQEIIEPVKVTREHAMTHAQQIDGDKT